MEQNMITIRNLSKEFKGQNVLKNITMEIPKNCVYGLLGANGAGKSTLLKTITGLLNPTSGEIYFEGHKWTRADLADIGALIETPPIYENLTAWENMKVRALLLGIPDEKIQKVLNSVCRIFRNIHSHKLSVRIQQCNIMELGYNSRNAVLFRTCNGNPQNFG